MICVESFLFVYLVLILPNLFTIPQFFILMGQGCVILGLSGFALGFGLALSLASVLALFGVLCLRLGVARRCLDRSTLD